MVVLLPARVRVRLGLVWFARVEQRGPKQPLSRVLVFAQGCMFVVVCLRCQRILTDFGAPSLFMTVS